MPAIYYIDGKGVAVIDNCLSYKGYVGSVEYSAVDAVFHGRVLGVKSLLSYEGDSVDSITEDFQNAVDEYLEYCADKGMEPEHPVADGVGVYAMAGG